MKRLEVSGAVRPMYGSLGVKRLRKMLHVTLYLSLVQYSGLAAPIFISNISRGTG